MTYPSIRLTRFDRQRGSNLWHDTNIYPTGGSAYTISMYMNDCIKRQSTLAGEPSYWTCGEYIGKKAHKKSCIKTNTAVVLEYLAGERAALERKLQSLGYEYYLVETDCKDHNKVAAIIPLDVPQPNSAKDGYTRTVSLLVNDLGIYNLTEGVDAETFLVRPIPNRTVVHVAGKPLNWSAYIRKNKGRFITTAKYTKPAPGAPLGMALPAAAAAQLYPPTITAEPADDAALWEWPKIA